MIGIITTFVCVLFMLINQSQGKVSLKSGDATRCVVPGENEEIQWTFDNPIPDLIARVWSFKGRTIASITRNGTVSYSGGSLSSYEVKRSGLLILKHTDASYNGTYSFQAIPSTGVDKSFVTVFVAAKPTAVIDCSTPTTVDRGDNVRCVCRSTGGNPSADLTWLKNGKKLAPTSNTLSFNDADETMNGTYTCVARSCSLKDEKSIEIRVRPTLRPVVISFTSNVVQATLGKSIKIICKSSGRPKPKFTIVHNGTLNVSYSHTYTKDNVDYEDAGVYTCIAENESGRSSKNYTMRVGAPSDSSNDDSGAPVGLIVGVGIGVLALVLIIVGVVWWRRSKEKKKGFRAKTDSDENIRHYDDDGHQYDDVEPDPPANANPPGSAPTNAQNQVPSQYSLLFECRSAPANGSVQSTNGQSGENADHV